MASFLGPVNGKLTIGSTSTELAIGGSQTTGDITIGGSQTTGQIVLGKTKKVKQIFELPDGSTVEDVTGNTDSVNSYSRTFNHKNIIVAGSTPIYRIDVANKYTLQYFELNVSGTNNGAGIYSYKYSFVINSFGNPVGGSPYLDGLIVPYSYAYGGPDNFPTAAGIIFSNEIVGDSITLKIQTPFNPNAQGVPNQAYSTILIGYPTIWNTGTSNDYSITAL